jgi:ubiquinone/menaquinone biosynthesis C-methylase UbiE
VPADEPDPAREDDPVTGRRTLTRSAYADDRHLRSRQAIWAYAERPVNPRRRTSVVEWDGTQLVADVGCGNGLDLRPLVLERRCRHAFGIDLSPGMLRSLEDLRRSGRLSLIQADAQRLPLRDQGVDVAMAMHMLYHVPDVPAAVRELRRIVRPGGTVLASTNGDDTLAEVWDLVDAALSERLGRAVSARPALSFTTETGRAFLEAEFSDVTLHRNDLPLAFPGAEPVVSFLGSIREPILLDVGEAFDFDGMLSDVAARVEQVVQAHGRFRATGRAGVFVCR